MVTAESGVKLAEVGGRFYASVWSEFWPDVDVKGVENETWVDLAIDERAEASA